MLNFSLMATQIRNFRITDEIWKPAQLQAQKAGISLSLVVKTALQQFSANPRITIGKVEEVKMPRTTQKLADRLAIVADQAIAKKLRRN